VLLVEHARKDAEKIQEEAREEAEHYFRKAHEEVLKEIETYRTGKMNLANQSASEITSESLESARTMELEYKKRMGIAASYIAGQVTGKDHVLSSRDEESNSRSP